MSFGQQRSKEMSKDPTASTMAWIANESFSPYLIVLNQDVVYVHSQPGAPLSQGTPSALFLAKGLKREPITFPG
jgi:hypothetical protein